jgi:hypothetical protein
MPFFGSTNLLTEGGEFHPIAELCRTVKKVLMLLSYDMYERLERMTVYIIPVS